MKKPSSKSPVNTKKSTAKGGASGSKALELVAIAAGLMAADQAIAATEAAPVALDQLDAARLADDAVAQGESEVVQDVVVSLEQDAPSAEAVQGESIQLADASGALGIQTEAPLQLAQAATAQVGTSAAGSAATAEAAATTAGTASTAGAAQVGVAGALSAVSPGVVAAVAVGAVAVAVDANNTSSTPTPTPPAAVAGGLAAKGILSGATVYYDLDGDGQYTAGVDPSGITGANGKYSINLNDAQKAQVATGLNDLGKTLKLVVTGGTDTVSGLAFTGSLTSEAPTDPSVEGKINIFSTMKAAGMSDAALKEMLGGRDLSDLTDDDFDSADGLESVAMKLWALVSDKIGGDADAANAAMSALGAVLEKLSADGGDLAALLGEGGLDASALESMVGAAVDEAMALYDAGKTPEEIEAELQAYADASDLSAFTDGDFSDSDALAAAAALASAEDLQAKLSAYGATLLGSAVRIGELGLQNAILDGQYVASADADVGLIVDADAVGTLLDNSGLQELNGLGIDVINTEDNGSDLHFTSSDLAYAASSLNLSDFPTFTDGDGAGAHAIAMVAQTTLDGGTFDDVADLLGIELESDEGSLL